MAARPRFGANYVPSSQWFYSWLDFSADAARRDLDDLASIGLDHVRVFPIWPWIQPNRGHIRRAPIDDLLTLIDIAGERGLSVAVDLLQGHMSSHDFLPAWVLTHHHRSVFTDPAVREGIARYMDVVARAVSERDNVFAITLGNEVNNLWPYFDTTSAASREWASELLDVVAAAAPNVKHLYSVFDASWYHPQHPFDPADSVDLGDLTTVHSWVFNGVSDIDGPLGPATVSHADYLVELAAATSTDPNRGVWLQEIGVPQPFVPAADAAEFVDRTMSYVDSNPALWAVTWWCSHDLDRGLLDFPDHEYDLGLFTVDHEAKPAARALEKYIASRRPGAPARRVALECPIDPHSHPERRADIAPGSAFHAEWVRRRADGPIAIASPTCGIDESYLAARGITEVTRGEY
ncbi:MAG TPA: glycosyl hydrolase [Stackebrandtia sp.]|jgi:endo-1,4-beta-mannosidase|uniref:glycoside hydrolase 5 family protein n=1 Tax=Stackebrandtia sp. TaxID=2023065 RepID=UPI002D75E1A7|nr:glycosyl hydrolase [Stackebrandtia sp.]HZE40796.1 glycosyl hydrolase [Stackebrandtia sp.]